MAVFEKTKPTKTKTKKNTEFPPTISGGPDDIAWTRVSTLIVQTFSKSFMTNKASTILLYRQILRNAHAFPSIKRDKIVQEIRTSFRENKFETDGAKIEGQISLARKGLSQLMMYTDLRNKEYDWSVDMENEPMPQRGEKK